MNTNEHLPGENSHYSQRYLQFAASLITRYHSQEPFHVYLKKYFASNKKHGSRDRKQIASLCYNYFRLGDAVSKDVSVEERILLGIFLIENKSSPLLQQLKPEWNKAIHLPIYEKTDLVKSVFTIDKIFPFKDKLSEKINFQNFNTSFLSQPKLYIRIRPGHSEKVIQKLNEAGVSFEKIQDDCLSFASSEKISSLLEIDKDAVIQDYNSQRTGAFLSGYLPKSASGISVWDCCAASGGKSILVQDIFPKVKLTVSDTRKEILINLKERFAKAEIRNYQSFLADLSVTPPLEMIKKNPDCIIADVPCSGSGTWARTPEQLKTFSKKEIAVYSSLQKKIVSNASKCLSVGGYLLYITCSVFEMENEENINFFENELGLELLGSKYLEGFEMQADTLFVGMFRKS